VESAIILFMVQPALLTKRSAEPRPARKPRDRDMAVMVGRCTRRRQGLSMRRDGRKSGLSDLVGERRERAAWCSLDEATEAEDDHGNIWMATGYSA
jgi:hypothetical protein